MAWYLEDSEETVLYEDYVYLGAAFFSLLVQHYFCSMKLSRIPRM